MSDSRSRSRQDIVRTKLIEVARRRDTITYGEIGRLVRMPAVLVGRSLLDPINDCEHAEGRPLLSALVVSENTGVPGDGFWTVAKKLGLYEEGGGPSAILGAGAAASLFCLVTTWKTAWTVTLVGGYAMLAERYSKRRYEESRQEESAKWESWVR